MRRMGQLLAVLTMSLMLLTGCMTPKPRFKPKPIPEEYVSAPDDPRYNQPPQYPRNLLNKGLIKRGDSAPDGMGGKPGGGGGRAF